MARDQLDCHDHQLEAFRDSITQRMLSSVTVDHGFELDSMGLASRASASPGIEDLQIVGSRDFANGGHGLTTWRSSSPRRFRNTAKSPKPLRVYGVRTGGLGHDPAQLGEELGPRHYRAVGHHHPGVQGDGAIWCHRGRRQEEARAGHIADHQCRAGPNAQGTRWWHRRSACGRVFDSRYATRHATRLPAKWQVRPTSLVWIEPLGTRRPICRQTRQTGGFALKWLHGSQPKEPASKCGIETDLRRPIKQRPWRPKPWKPCAA